ncbi:hypothetical protein F5Y06DRAFT_255720 [Hypoxylon sp. FL0890]|nr:hypothetical protein F5Y06DRAFT_255720 [Hypoxylon sp. FL0890]
MGTWSFPHGDRILFIYEIPAEGGPLQVISSHTNIMRLMTRMQMRAIITGIGRFNIPPPRVLRRRQSEPGIGRRPRLGTRNGGRPRSGSTTTISGPQSRDRGRGRRRR